MEAVQTSGAVARAAGDNRWQGLNLREETELAPGEYADAANVRCRESVPETRKGVLKPLWAHRTNEAGALLPFWPPYGAGVFRDPTLGGRRRDWLFVACGAGLYRLTANNAPRPCALPAGVRISRTCTFAQAFNKLYLFRGRDFRTLVLSDTGTGFEDLLPFWSVGTEYAEWDRVTWGPWQTLGAGKLTSSGGTATVVLNGHGYVTGQDVTVRGASQTEYNGRFNLTKVDENTFTYAFGGSATSPATGTIKVSNMTAHWEASGDPDAGDEPGVDADWMRLYDVLPNAELGLYINNRLLVPTAYAPGVSAYDSSSSYTKADFLVATDVQDEVRFDFANEFRINQGSSDELVDLLKFSDDVVLVFKDGSWGSLTGVRLDLQNLSLDMRGREYGLASRGACVMAGQRAIFLAGKRGVVDVMQTEQGKIQGQDIPFSQDIERWINRIAWGVARNTARLAYWENKLYCALPLAGENPVERLASGAYDSEDVWLVPVRPGARYRWVKGETVRHLENGESILYADGDFLAQGDQVALQLTGGGGVPVSGSLVELRGDCNNTVLVYDFVQQKWAGRDTGSAMCVLEYALFPYQGVDRLFFLDAAGYVNLVEESDNGCDQVAGSDANGLGWEAIDFVWRTRRYEQVLDGLRRPNAAGLSLATWNPELDVQLIFEGVNKGTTALSGKTRDRTKYFRPWDAAPYDAGNAGDDHAAPYREDYSVDISAPGVLLGANGMGLDVFQEWLQRVPLRGREGRRFAIEIRNRRGKVRVHGVEVESADGRARKGTLV